MEDEGFIPEMMADTSRMSCLPMGTHNINEVQQPHYYSQGQTTLLGDRHVPFRGAGDQTQSKYEAACVYSSQDNAEDVKSAILYDTHNNNQEVGILQYTQQALSQHCIQSVFEELRDLDSLRFKETQRMRLL